MVPPRANALLVVGMTLAILTLSVSNSPIASGHRMVQFSSQDELQYFLKNNSIYCRDGRYISSLRGDIASFSTTTASVQSEANSVPAHSETNNQVAGVDELDTVKNDGRYVYTATGDKLIILKAYPAAEAGVVSTITVDGTIIGVFVRGDKLAVFGQVAQYGYYGGEMSLRSASFEPYWGSTNTTIWFVDIADRTSPVLRNTITVEGSYVGARMIGDFVYPFLIVERMSSSPA